ncbi:maestro heat-like repeat-containing protein family member 7 [Tiliqua scincoides]|uniref:maestro heat-like repeat-containing protein family member 7 n=1 Tax=Tiliqua scincoides TaxID=71010 RepID=UPI0034623AB8
MEENKKSQATGIGEPSKDQTEQHPLIRKEVVFKSPHDKPLKHLGIQLKAVRSKTHEKKESETELRRQSVLLSAEKLALNLYKRDLQESSLSENDEENDYVSSQLEGANLLMKDILDLPLDHIDADTTALCLQGMHLVEELSKVKPRLWITEKLLKICIASIFALPPLDILKKQSGDNISAEALYRQNVEALEEMLRHLLSERPNTTQLLILLDHMAPWMTSGLEHERARAVSSYVFLLECAATNPSFCISDDDEFPNLGLLIGQLCLRIYDPDTAIGNRAMEGIYILYYLMLRQQGNEMKTEFLNAEQCEVYRVTLGAYLPPSPGENITHIIKEFEPYLTSRQMTQLLLTAVGCLKQSNKNSTVASHTITHVILEQYKHKLQAQIPEIVDKIYLQLGSTYRFQGRQIMLKVVSVLAQTYMKDVCDALLQCPLPIDRYSTEMWHVLTKTFSDDELITLVHILLKKLQMNPKVTSNYITPLTVSCAFCKLFSVPRCADVALFIYPRVLMTLLVQLHYNIRHEMISTLVSEEECEPVRYYLKTLKTLFLAVKGYAEFCFIETDGEKLTSCKDHHRGVGRLARSMLENNSYDLLRILYLLVPFLERGDEEHQITALAFFVELLAMPEAKRLPEKYSLNRLKQGLSNENAVIRALCTKGLVKMADWPGKDIKVLLPKMTKGLSGMDGQLFVETVVEIEKILTSPEGANCICDISHSLQDLFGDEKESVRGSAIFLFGRMVKLSKKSNAATMKSQTLNSLVPLLLHLQEENSDITKNCKCTLDECVNFLGWKLPKQVVSDKAWYEHEDVLDETCKYLVKKHEGNLQRFLYQGLFYVESKLLPVKRASIMFLALEGLIHDKEETICVAAAHAHERVSVVLSKQIDGPNDSSIRTAGDTNAKSARISRSPSTIAVRDSSSSHFFGILGIWRSAVGK